MPTPGLQERPLCSPAERSQPGNRRAERNACEIFPWNLLQAGKKLPQNVSALPGGNRNNGSFNNAGDNGNWWSSTENDSGNAWNRNMNSNNDNVNRNNNDKSNGYSVRCLQNCNGAAGKPVSPLFIEMHKAYLDARKHKRNTLNQLKFERSLETELLSLCQEIETGTYELKPGICFINELPIGNLMSQLFAFQ
jgi:hypothetical protein